MTIPHRIHTGTRSRTRLNLTYVRISGLNTNRTERSNSSAETTLARPHARRSRPISWILVLATALGALSQAARALDAPYTPGELVSQAAPAGGTWAGNRGWIQVVESIGRDGKLGIRTAPAQPKSFLSATFPLPDGPADSGVVDISFDMYVSNSGEGQAIGLTFGRDAEGPEAGRGLRLIVSGQGDFKVVTPETNTSVDEEGTPTGAAGGWISVEVSLDFGRHEASLTVDGSQVASVPFIVEKGTKQDSRGVVQIATGGGTESVVDFDNFIVRESKP